MYEYQMNRKQFTTKQKQMNKRQDKTVEASNELEAMIKGIYKTPEALDTYIEKGISLFGTIHTYGVLKREKLLMLTPPWKAVVPKDSVIEAPEDAQPEPASYVWAVQIESHIKDDQRRVYQIPTFGFNTLFGCSQLIAVNHDDLIGFMTVDDFKKLVFKTGKSDR